MKHRSPASRRQLGATLVELMIVVGIVSAIAGMAVANMPRLQLDMRIGRAAHIVTGLTREARGRALANRAFMEVRINSSSILLREKNCPFGATSTSATGCESWSVVRRYVRNSNDFKHVLFNGAADPIVVRYRPDGVLLSGAQTIKVYATTQPNAVAHNVLISQGGWSERQ